MPDVSDIAPDFTLPSTDGTDVTLSSLAPCPCHSYSFYPRDDTPGCTKESIGFSELAQETLLPSMRKASLGISKDSLASHAKFIAKREISQCRFYPMNTVRFAKTFGVWKEKEHVRQGLSWALNAQPF